MILMEIEKGIRGGICHSVHWYTKANNKYMDYDKNKESSYRKYWIVDNLYPWAMSQKLSVYGLKVLCYLQSETIWVVVVQN